MGTIDYDYEVQLDVNSWFGVFSLLDVKDKQNVAQVSRYWKEIVYLRSLWKNVCVTLRNIDHSLATSLEQRRITRIVCRGSTDEDLAILFNANPHITSLKIDGCRQVTQQFLQRNLITLNELCSLHITRCPVDIESLFQEISLTGLLSRLKSVTLPRLNSSSFQDIIKKFPGLEEIDDDSDDCFELIDIGENCMKILVQSCPKIQSLRLRRLYTGWLSQEAWTTVFKGLPLRCIDLTSLHYNIGYDGFNFLKVIADNLPNLESLKTDSLAIDSNNEVIDAVKKLKNLKEFSFRIADQYDHDDYLEQKEEKLLHEISKMTQLECLKVRLCGTTFTGETIYSLVECLSKLRSLELEPIGNISSEYADLIGERLTKLKSLKAIALEGAAGIGAFSNHLPNLTDLNIKAHGKLLNRDMKEITSGLLPSKLKSFNIAGSKKIRDQGLTYIATGLKSLTCLDISSCSVSNVGLTIISEELKHLKQLSVTGRKVTNQGAIMIGKHLKALEKLKISGTKISDQGFAFICQQLPNLRNLQAFCDLLTDQGFSQGSTELGKLTTLHIGSHRIRAVAMQDSLKNLKSVEQCSIRSIGVTDGFIERMIKEMPCLVKLLIYRCSHLRNFRSFNINKAYELCRKNGIAFNCGPMSCIKLPFQAP